MIRHVTFGYLISMMSSCRDLDHTKFPWRVVYSLNMAQQSGLMRPKHCDFTSLITPLVNAYSHSFWDSFWGITGLEGWSDIDPQWARSYFSGFFYLHAIFSENRSRNETARVRETHRETHAKRYMISVQERRHGFESGGKLCERSEQKIFLTQHFGQSGIQNIV